MTAPDPMTILRYYLLVDDLDDAGESSVFSSMMYLKGNMFPAKSPFESWSDEERKRAAIAAMIGLANDGLVEFWDAEWVPGKRFWNRAESTEWIHHLISIPVANERLERLMPDWWNRDRVDDFDWGRTDAGERLFEQWVAEPPEDVRS